MPTGIRNAVDVTAIVAAMQTLETNANWNGKTATLRCTDIANVVVARLAIYGVHAPALDVRNLDAQGLNGQFDYQPWTLQVNETLAADIPPTAPANPAEDLRLRRMAIAQFADTITHEARHCEQWFRMARLIAEQFRAKGMLVTAKVVAGKLRPSSEYAANVNEPAIGTAITYSALNPLSALEKSEVESWFESVYGSGGSSRELRYNPAFGNRTQVQTKVGGQQTTAISQGVQVQAFASYQRGLAEEEDAHGLGLHIQTAYLTPYGLAPNPMVTNHGPVAAGIQRY